MTNFNDVRAALIDGTKDINIANATLGANLTVGGNSTVTGSATTTGNLIAQAKIKLGTDAVELSEKDALTILLAGLPGVTSASNATGLVILAANIFASGTFIGTNTGITSCIHTGLGVNTLNFAYTFAALPVVIACLSQNTGVGTIIPQALSTTSIEIRCFDSSFLLADRDFSVFIIGTRAT